MVIYQEWKPNAEHELLMEPFLFSGGNSEKTVNKTRTENIRDTLNESINKTMLSTETNMSTTIDASQEIDLDFTECSKQFQAMYLEQVKIHNDGKTQCITSNPGAEGIKACGESYPPPPSMDEVTPCTASNITQDLKMTFKEDGEVSVDDVEKVQNKLREELENRASDESDSFGSALNTVAGAARDLANRSLLDAGNSSTTINDDSVLNKTNIINRTVNMVDKEFITNLSKNLSASQSLKSKDGKLSFISQSMSIDVVSKMTAQNSTFREMVEDIEKIDKNVAETDDKGITDVAETAGDVAEQVVQSGESVANRGIEAGETVGVKGLDTFGNIMSGPFLIVLGIVALIALIFLYKKFSAAERVTSMNANYAPPPVYVPR